MPITNARRKFLYHNNPEYRKKCKERQKRYLSCYGKIDYLKRKNSGYLVKYYKRIREEKPWEMTLRAIKSRCFSNKKSFYFRRGIKCLITKEELKILWFRDKAYGMVNPSIDRIDNNGDYVFNNCRYIERKVNSGRSKQRLSITAEIIINLIKETNTSFYKIDIRNKALYIPEKKFNNLFYRLNKAGFFKVSNKPKNRKEYSYIYVTDKPWFSEVIDE